MWERGGGGGREGWRGKGEFRGNRVVVFSLDELQDYCWGELSATPGVE